MPTTVFDPPALAPATLRVTPLGDSARSDAT